MFGGVCPRQGHFACWDPLKDSVSWPLTGWSSGTKNLPDWLFDHQPTSSKFGISWAQINLSVWRSVQEFERPERNQFLLEKFQSTPSSPDVETEWYFAVYVPVSRLVLASYEVGDDAKKRPMHTFINHMLYTSREQRSNTKVKGCIKNHHCITTSRNSLTSSMHNCCSCWTGKLI